MLAPVSTKANKLYQLRNCSNISNTLPAYFNLNITTGSNHSTINSRKIYKHNINTTEKSKYPRKTKQATHPYLAAAAKRFLALGAPGSTDRDLAASNSLLEAIEMLLRLPMT